MAGANGGWPAPPTLQLASNLLRSISPTASTIRWMMSSSGSHSIMSTGSRKRCRRSGVRKKWAIDPHLGSMAPRESRPPPQRHYLLMPRGHQFAVRYGNRLLDGLVAGAVLGDVPAEQLGVPVLGDAEQPDLAILDGGHLGGVSGPHDVRRGGDNVPLVRRLRPRAGPVRREQAVLAHEPQYPLARDPDAVHRPQPGPHLAVALASPG